MQAQHRQLLLRKLPVLQRQLKKQKRMIGRQRQLAIQKAQLLLILQRRMKLWVQLLAQAQPALVLV